MTWADRQDAGIARNFGRPGPAVLLRTVTPGDYAGGVRTGGTAQSKSVLALLLPVERDREPGGAAGDRGPVGRRTIDLRAAELAADPAIAIDEARSTVEVDGEVWQVANVETMSEGRVLRVTLERGK